MALPIAGLRDEVYNNADKLLFPLSLPGSVASSRHPALSGVFYIAGMLAYVARRWHYRRMVLPILPQLLTDAKLLRALVEDVFAYQSISGVNWLHRSNPGVDERKQAHGSPSASGEAVAVSSSATV